MAGEFKYLRPTSESHLFQQELRQSRALERRARRDRDQVASAFYQGQQRGASNLFEVDAVVRKAYDPKALFTDPVDPFFPGIVGISPDHGPAAGGTHVVIEVEDSTGVTGAAVGGLALDNFAIDDETHVSGDTQVHAAGGVDVTVTNFFGVDTLSEGFTYDSGAPEGVNPWDETFAWTGSWGPNYEAGTTLEGRPSAGTSGDHDATQHGDATSSYLAGYDVPTLDGVDNYFTPSGKLSDYINAETGECSGVIAFRPFMLDSYSLQGLFFASNAWKIVVSSSGVFFDMTVDGGGQGHAQTSSIETGETNIVLFRYKDGVAELSSDLGSSWQTEELPWGAAEVDATTLDVFMGKNGSLYFPGAIVDVLINDTAYTRSELAEFGVHVFNTYCIPFVDTVTPAYGQPGDVMTMHGSGFINLTSVALESHGEVVFNVIDDSTCEITLIEGPTPDEGPQLVLNDGVSLFANKFTYYPTPSPSVCYPDTGTSGDTITITGSGFGGATEVYFNDVLVDEFDIDEMTGYISIDVPSGLLAGPVDIRVVNPQFEGTAEAAFTHD